MVCCCVSHVLLWADQAEERCELVDPKTESKLKPGCKMDETINIICLLLTGGSSGHKQTPSMTGVPAAMFQEIMARKNG